MSDQEFLYDDFFSPQNHPGIPTTIEVRGKPLTIGLRILSFGDVQKLMQKNTRITVGADGKPQVEILNDEEGNMDLILASLKSWPFKNRDGSMVEINAQTLSEMHPDVLGAILQAVTEFSQKTLKANQEGINGPFVKP
jgi:hypothetical protein